jgi:hypothetical protein
VLLRTGRVAPSTPNRTIGALGRRRTGIRAAAHKPNHMEDPGQADEGIYHRFMERHFDSPDQGGAASETAEMVYNPDPPPRDGAPRSEIALVLERNEQLLLAIEGVEGVAIGQNRIGQDVIVVYIRDASVRDRVPTQIEGYPVETVVTGPIKALSGP